MKNYEELVGDFHAKYGHYTSNTPNLNVPDSIRNLRIDLIAEEAKEMILALQENDLVEIADGAADIIYVVIGTLIAYGIPLDRVFREVHASNMTKTAVKAELGEKYGTKTPKGPDYVAPDIRTILFTPSELTTLEKRSLENNANI